MNELRDEDHTYEVVDENAMLSVFVADYSPKSNSAKKYTKCNLIVENDWVTFCIEITKGVSISDSTADTNMGICISYLMLRMVFEYTGCITCIYHIVGILVMPRVHHNSVVNSFIVNIVGFLVVVDVVRATSIDYQRCVDWTLSDIGLHYLIYVICTN